MGRYDEDLAYGDIPQRWDRNRFERYSRGGPGRTSEESFRFVERDSPGRRDVMVSEREKSRGPRGRFEERDRFFEEERTLPGGRRRRTDRELFGDLDPREVADMALMPYERPRSVSRRRVDINISSPRPGGLLRRQSSLDTFDRRGSRAEEPRLPPYVPIPLPIRRPREEFESEGYREVEIQRERSVHRRGGRRSVKEEVKSISAHESDSSGSESFHEKEEKISVRGGGAPSVRSRARSAVHAPPSVRESIHETEFKESIRAPSVHASVQESDFERSVREERKFKKGKTRFPKRLIRVEAIRDLGYPFDEEEHFIVLRIALQKEEIDEVISLSAKYKDTQKVYRYEEQIDESVSSVPPPPIGEREVVERTEWINPPSVIGPRSGRSRSRVSRRVSRSRSPGTTVIEERKTVIESRGPGSAYRPPSPPPPPEFFEERQTVIEERSPSHVRGSGALIIAERENVTDRDINLQIRALERESRALRLEREADEQRALALRIRERRPDEELGLIEVRRPRSEYLEIVTRDRSPDRNIIRIEKDKKDKEKRERNNARLLGAALATLT